MKTVVILSGGMDSTTLLYDIVKLQNHDCHAVSFYYGQKHDKEIACAERTAAKLNVPHRIIDLDGLNEIAPSALTRKNIAVPTGHYMEESMKTTVVPARNLIFLSMAAAYAISLKADFLAYGAHGGDHAIYPDCRPEFIQAARKAILLSDWHQVDLFVPYQNLNKTEILKIGLEANVDYRDTWTCYVGAEKACGKCGSCVERLEAFDNLDIPDPLPYGD